MHRMSTQAETSEQASKKLKRSPEEQARYDDRRRRYTRPLVRWIISPLLRLYSATWRKRLVFESEAGREAVRKGCLAVLWHGRGLSLLPVLRGHQAAILVSPSLDGLLVRCIVESWGFDTVEGSNRRAGALGLRAMLGALRHGSNVVVTPDGPPGPEHTMSTSIAFLAQRTGHPILPMGVGVSRAWRLSSYDRYTVPKPFARVTVFLADPVHIPEEPRDEQAHVGWTEDSRQALMRAEERAFAELGLPVDL